MIRPVDSSDLSALMRVIDSTGLFPSDLLDDMVGSFQAGDAGRDIWLTAAASEPVGVLYCAPERMTEGTWNNLLLAVHSDRHGQGIGTRLLAHVEAMLRAQGVRLLLVETSGLPAFERTRRFYAHAGYKEEARIRDFYQAGEDKIVFAKALQTSIC